MEINQNSLPFYRKKEFIISIINELLFYGYLVFVNNMVLSMLGNIEITNHEGRSEIKENMPGSTLAFIIMVAFILEIVGFIKIPASKNHKALILFLTGIPRLFLFWEITRILMISFSHKITTGGSILLFFMVPVLLIITFIIFGLREEKKPEKEKLCSRDFNFLFVLPFYCLWFSLFEKAYLPDLWGGNWFVYIGLYSVFMYFPLRLPAIIIQIKSKSMSKWKIAMLVIQPVVAYFMVYKNLL